MLVRLCAALLTALPAQVRAAMVEAPSDEIFWSPDPAAVLGKAVPAQPGVALFAPSRVEVASRQTLPVVLRRKATMADDALSPLPQFGVLFAVDPRSGRAAAALASPPAHGEGEFREPDPKTLKKMMPGMTTRTLVADLRKLLGVPWGAGEVVVYGFAGLERSQPVRVVLEGPAVDAAKFGNELDAKVTAAKGKASPPLPAADAVALSFDSKRHELHGAYRPGGEQVIHLVFCGRRYPAPFVVRIFAGAEGTFALDVSTARLPPQKYRVWAVARDGVAGPTDVTVPEVH
jgi:hypothetical protein